MNAAVALFTPPADLYLRTYLEPFARWLEEPDVTEILVNRPGEAWIERNGHAAMQCERADEIDDQLLQRLATQIARVSHQGISRDYPLLAATLPGGERVQVVAPPATPRHWAIAIRRHVGVDLALDDYACLPAASTPAQASLFAEGIEGLRESVRARKTILVSGGTSSGKTTFVNALLKEVPADERIVVVEDTPEVQLTQANALRLVAVKDPAGASKVDTDELLRASLRLRPDRILLGEVRGPEAVTFLRAINTGHPGSFTTIHANTAQGALSQLALMVMQAGIGMTRQDALDYIRGLVDVVVQLQRVDGVRCIREIVSF